MTIYLLACAITLAVALGPSPENAGTWNDCREWRGTTNIYIHGQTGVGKTYGCVSACRDFPAGIGIGNRKD